jgi:hypothetical protein
VPRVGSTNRFEVALVEDCIVIGSVLPLRTRSKDEAGRTFPLPFQPLLEPLFPTQNRLTQPLPFALVFLFLRYLSLPQHSRPRSRPVSPPAQLLIELDDLVDGVSEDGRDGDELGKVVSQAGDERGKEEGGELVLWLRRGQKGKIGGAKKETYDCVDMLETVRVEDVLNIFAEEALVCGKQIEDVRKRVFGL